MSKIEWCDETWNPITGCSPISEGCQNCYAKRMATRLRGRFGYPKGDPFKVTIHDEKFYSTWKNRKIARYWTAPRKIFVCSMGDLFHENVRNLELYRILKIIQENPHCTFMVLTKRAERAKKYFTEDYCKSFGDYQTEKFVKEQMNTVGIKNLWLGVTAENQKRADERIPTLLQIPAAVRFVSVEPMLEPISIRSPAARGRGFREFDWINKIDWVIAGPETGPKARPCKPEWIEDLYEQCKVAGIPFFDKRKTGWLAREYPKT